MTNENINKISAYLLAYLRDKTSQEGMSQNKYAQITGVKQGTINGFLNTSDKRPRPISGASLDLILRLFPELQRPILQVLEGHGVSNIQQVGVVNQAAGGDLTITTGDGDAARLRQQVTDLAVRLSDDNGALQLATFLKALQTLG